MREYTWIQLLLILYVESAFWLGIFTMWIIMDKYNNNKYAIFIHLLFSVYYLHKYCVFRSILMSRKWILWKVHVPTMFLYIIIIMGVCKWIYVVGFQYNAIRVWPDLKYIQ